MRFQEFIKFPSWLLLGGLVSILWTSRPCLAQPNQDFDVLIRGGFIYDGSGNRPRRADLGIKGDRIAAVGDLAGDGIVEEAVLQTFDDKPFETVEGLADLSTPGPESIFYVSHCAAVPSYP